MTSDGTSEHEQQSQISVPSPRPAGTPARLVGNRVVLRALRLDDYEFLYGLATGAESIWRWRHRGVTPPPEQFPQFLWQGTFVQFLITGRSDGEPIGLVQSYDADLRNDVISLALIVAPRFEQQGLALEAAGLFVNYLFEGWRFRKIYMDSVEFAVWKFWSGAGRLFHVEGCFLNHEYHDGQYWHLYKLALYRDEWFASGARLLGVSNEQQQD